MNVPAKEQIETQTPDSKPSDPAAASPSAPKDTKKEPAKEPPLYGGREAAYGPTPEAPKEAKS